MKELAGEWPTVMAGPGEEMGIGLGTCRGLEGELANREELGEGWGSMEGEGLMLVGREGGEARLNEVTGLEPKFWCCVCKIYHNVSIIIK